jgi:ribosome biogenesis GTPase / thiamine phosphate phosphatase
MLQRVGWDTDWDEARRAVDPDCALSPVRVVAEHRGAYHATDGDGIGWVELTGKAFHSAKDKRELPTVGDFVVVENWDKALAAKGAATIRHLLPRRGLLVRKAAGEATVPQPLAANVDVGVVMTSANSDLSPARIDRYLSLLRDGGIHPVLLLSKIDLIDDPAPMVAQLKTMTPHVLAISTVTGAGVDDVRALAGAGKTAVLLGSSGVGKSSLLNAMIGTHALTQEIRDDDRGKHTTTHRELFISDAGLWIDTPGMRELAQWLDDEDVVFEDIEALAVNCRFRDCQHRAEPDCAVRGKIDDRRLASFHKLLEERATGAVKQHAAQRLAETRRAKVNKYAPRPGKPDDEK